MQKFRRLDQHLILRLSLATACGLLSAGLLLASNSPIARGGGDFVGRSVTMARDLLQGIDPYSHAVTWLNVPYPLPAALLGLPFVWLRDDISGAAFMAISTFILALGLTRDRQYWRLLALLSYPFIESVLAVQFSPLLMAALFYPDLIPLGLIKPQIGLALLAWLRPTRRSVGVALGILSISLLIYPTWPLRWLSQIGDYRSVLPVLLPIGVMVLIVLRWWRDPAARLLAALAVLPKRGFYDHLYLFAIPNTVFEMVLLVAVSWAAQSMFDGTAGGSLIFLYFSAAMLIAGRHGEQARQAVPATG